MPSPPVNSATQSDSKPVNKVSPPQSPSASNLKKSFLVRPNVGPGQYEPKVDLTKNKSPVYSMHNRVNTDLNKSKVGPGDYDLKSQFENRKSGYQFSKDKRDVNDRRGIPGPGSYSYEKAISQFRDKQEPKFGFGSRIKEKYSDNPGPGHYEGKQNYYSKIGGIISRDIKLTETQYKNKVQYSVSKQVPGPGSYQPDKYYDNEWTKGKGKYSLGKSSRDQKYLKNPGPGTYENSSGILKKQGKIVFDKEEKLKLGKNGVPGPGQYQSKSYFSKISKKHIF